MRQFWNCLLIFTLVVSFTFGKKIDYQKIETNKFGKNLLDVISLQLGQKNYAVDDLKHLINELNSQLLRDEDRANQAHEQYVKKCGEDKAEFNSVITLASDILNNNNIKTADLITRLTKTEEELNLTSSEYNSFKEKLEAATTRKRQDDEEYSVRIKENEEVKNVISRVLKMFTELKEGANSFLDLKSINFLQVSSFFKKQVKSLKNLKYRAMLEFMAQISERTKNMSDDIIEKIIELCNKILVNIEESAKSEQVSHETRTSSFFKFESEMKEIIEKREAEIVSLSLTSKTITADIERLKRETEFQTDRKERATHDLEITMKSCQDELTAFEKQKSRRGEEIEIVAELLQIVRNDLENLKQYIKERLDSQ